MRKVALITGSSRGIGRACAEALAKEGWAVCINCVERADLAAELCEKLRAEGADAIWVQADVADGDAVKAMVAKTEKELGKVTLLINNAGIAKQELFQDIDRATWDRVFAVNLGGCYNTIQAVLPSMLHEHSGCIINMSSIWGSHGASCEVSYSSTKHAIIGLT
ncbi:MAG: SDR family NAD(P)-dependent oxidoreductase, partial [Oscillospiraceae bacterium]|nr:SDR family NAD(P)-dependent oxidoreductase [Oscillospiraceae bacterium]